MKPIRSGWVLLLAICVCLTACDQTDQIADSTSPNSKSKLVGSNLTALQVIEACKQAYKSLDSYQDEGFVQLSYQVNGQLTEDKAPLSIAFNKPGMLGIRAYGVEAGPTSGRWYLKLAESDRSAVAGQIISRAIPSKADFTWLLSDPSINEELSAGLAGFPPQLDMLLSADPMRGLISDASALALEAPEYVDDKKHYVVRVTRQGASYRLWIDQHTMLLRRLEMPNANLSPEMLADTSVTHTQLTIELPRVRINSPISWSRFEVSTKSDSKLVSRFVPAPPPLPTDRLGSKIPAFKLKNAVERDTINVTGTQITVLTWLADHPACRTTAEQIAEISKAIGDGPLASKVQFVSVWAEPKAPQGQSFDQLAVKWKLPGALAIDSEAIGRDLFNVREAPTVVVIDQQNRLQIFEERSNPFLVQLLPDLISRIAGGENLASEVNRTAALEKQRHVAELWMSAAVDAKRENFQQPTAYRPRAVSLTESIHKTSIAADAQVVALNVDDSQTLWLLTSDGRLCKEDPTSKNKSVFQTPWKLDSSRPVRLEVSPGGQFIAVAQSNGNAISMFDTSNEQNRDFRLSQGERAIDFSWVTLVGSKVPRLAVVTSDSETKLLDPNNREQLSGHCPSEPMALLPQTGLRSPIGGLVVLADRTIESLIMSPETAYQSESLGRPASHTLKSDGSASDRINDQPLSVNSDAVPKKLGFQPADGPWKTIRVGEGTSILARGWIAQDEPAVFLLNGQLQQQWHYRMPLMTDKGAIAMSTACVDPSSGQAIWAISQSNQVIHLLRGDGTLTDHFQLDQPIRGLGFVPVGDRTMLYVAHPKEVVVYTLNR